jgi:hypothetical protein
MFPGVTKEVRTFMVPTFAFGAKRVVRFDVPATFMFPGVTKEVRTFMVSTFAFGAKRVVRFDVPATFMFPGVTKEVRTFMVSTFAFGAKRVRVTVMFPVANILLVETELETKRLETG